MKRLTCLSGYVLGVALCTSSADASQGPATIAEAVKRADRTALRAMLRKHVDVNVPERDGTTALHWAAHGDDVESAISLIRAGANAKAKNRHGVTPLALASSNGNATIIEALLKAGADPNVASLDGETPLMLAARSGIESAVKALIAHGAAVNAREGWKGQTALMWAAAEGQVAVIEALIAAGADLEIRSKGGLTPFLFAVRESQVDAVRVLLASGAKVDDTIISDVPEQALGNTNTPVAATGIAPNDASALLLAIGNAHFELASMLLDAGANPNFAPQGWTALHELTWVRKPGQGSNDPAPPGSGLMDSLEIVRMLAAHGANLNARAAGRRVGVMTHLNLNGGTPFFFAARTGDAALMQLLVELGADPTLPNEDNTTPLIAAAGLGTRSPGEDAGTESECLEAVKLALDLGNDVNAIDKLGNTAMHGAAMKFMPSIVNLLAERGANIEIWNKQNSTGWTPLRIAAGVLRKTGDFRFDVATTKAIQERMAAAGVSREIDAGTTVIGAIPAK